MIYFDFKKLTITLAIKEATKKKLLDFLDRYFVVILVTTLSLVSAVAYLYYLENGLGVAYNDARSHLDIGRRVVENLKPGLAQLGSVWLPLPHFLMIFTVWSDVLWHSGLSGALQSMISFVATGSLIYFFLKRVKVGWVGRIFGVVIFVTNLNVLYLQSTAMTELLLLATMLAGVYEILIWHMNGSIQALTKSAFWIMLSTLIRYEGWFLFLYVTVLIFIRALRSRGYKNAEGAVILFGTLAGFGIFIWLLWNQLIFRDLFYFISGPYSAAVQQIQLAQAGVLPTKHNLFFSIMTYVYAVIFNSSFFLFLVSILGAFLFFTDKNVSKEVKLASSALFVPFLFNVMALYMGQSVLYVQNLNGSWFNVRYGLMMIPAEAMFAGFFIHKVCRLRWIFLGMFLFVSFFSVVNRDIVTLDDALVGASGKNVKEVSGWLANNASPKGGFILISVASHDAIIFSSGMRMSRFIHEGTGDYWDLAKTHPASWARWIVMRTYDDSDSTYRLLRYNKEFINSYKLIRKYPFADIYELKEQYLGQLNTRPVTYANK